MGELLRNSEFVWVAMAILIFLITLVVKYPFKKLTSKIKDETKRKLANKAIVIFAFAIGFVLNLIYCHCFNVVFTIQASLKYSLTAISLHSVLEIKSGGKITNEYNTAEGQEVVEKATEYVNGTSQKTVKNTDKKKSKGDSAVADFWKSVKKK